MDYVLVKRYCLRTFYLCDWEIMRADVNNDGVLNGQDYAIIKRAVLGTYDLEKVDYLFDHAD